MFPESMVHITVLPKNTLICISLVVGATNENDGTLVDSFHFCHDIIASKVKMGAKTWMINVECTINRLNKRR